MLILRVRRKNSVIFCYIFRCNCVLAVLLVACESFPSDYRVQIDRYGLSCSRNSDATLQRCFVCLQPAQWQLSPDGKRLIGHMTLRKPISDNDSVGEGRAGEPGGAVGRGALGKFSVLWATIGLSCSRFAVS